MWITFGSSATSPLNTVLGVMSCIPRGTKKISGKWDYSNGTAKKDANWLLIERYIQEESLLMGRGTRGYLVAELDAERGWTLTYAENDDLKLGPPTLELFHDLQAFLEARDKQYTDSILIWQRRYLEHLENPTTSAMWPGAESNLFKIIVSSNDFRVHWISVRHRYDQRFQQFIDGELYKYEEGYSDDA